MTSCAHKNDQCQCNGFCRRCVCDDDFSHIDANPNLVFKQNLAILTAELKSILQLHEAAYNDMLSGSMDFNGNRVCDEHKVPLNEADALELKKEWDNFLSEHDMVVRDLATHCIFYSKNPYK